MPEFLVRMVVGAVDGAVATLAMTGAMDAERRIGLLGEYPPVEVTERAVDRSGTARGAPPRTKQLLAALLHLGFGAGAGALFALLRTVLLRPFGRVLPGPLLGAVFGLGVWAASYLGWLPALGLLPPPSRSEPRRPAAMIAAHLVYGGVLGLTGDLAEQVPLEAVGGVGRRP